ncbi:MAG: nicotinate-nucleotide--dimethylbenzimidazole phosphoribosyltransferase [Ruminococcaceae bacterium]|nr:nicotinate-nucleotide--dimethylbenzimidazole phosphoribosyltransferase [Oscillospiraceae bacterium]
MELEIQKLIDSVGELDKNAMDAARKRQDELAKPPGALGRLEDLSIQLAGITGKVNNTMDKRALLVFAADNGVVEEGIASCPQSITLMQTINLTRGKTGAGTLCKHYGVDLFVCDVGVYTDINCPEVINRKIAYGTKNFTKGPAMTREQALKAFLTGVEMVETYCKDMNVVGIGEMGIGNTTTSAAVLAFLTDSDPEDVTGKGAGVTEESFTHKKECVKKAIEINAPNKDDIINVLSKIGGFDLCAMTGAFMATAANRIPVVIDGFISVVAALCAVRMCPNIRHFLIPSHASFEIGYKIAIKELELEPMLLLGMRLGEGSGCPLAMHILDCACTIINEMSDFVHANIDDTFLDEYRNGDKFTVEGKS